MDIAAGGPRDQRLPAVTAPRVLTWFWDAHDRHLWATHLALFGLLVAGLLALFGIPPVDLHPPFHRLGVMDPLCGGTRAPRYTAQGHFLEAWKFNPLGLLTVIGATSMLMRAIAGRTLGRWLTCRIAWTPRRFLIATGVVVLLLAALEVRQQLRADLLMGGT